jgi:hypothetical protein
MEREEFGKGKYSSKERAAYSVPVTMLLELGEVGFKKTSGRILMSIPLQTHSLGYIILSFFLLLLFWREAHLDIIF